MGSKRIRQYSAISAMGVMTVFYFSLFFQRVGFRELGFQSFFLGMDFFCLLIVFSIYLSVVFDYRTDDKLYVSFRALLVLEYLSLFCCFVSLLLSPLREGFFLKLCLTGSFLNSVLQPVASWIFFDAFLGKQSKKWIETVFFFLAAVVVGLFLANLFCPLVFHFNEEGVMVHDPFFGKHSMVPLVILLSTILRVVRSPLDFKAKLTFILVPLLPFFGICLTIFFRIQNSSVVYVLSLFSLLLVYSYLFFHRSLELATAKEELKQKELEQSEQRQRVLLSQIQPHFVFNTLSVIAMLSKKDKEKASSITVDFADYLRHNLESLSSEPMIPFSRELENVKKYVNIQQTRFGDELSVIYNIQAEDFLVPSLSIQPLVENAVIHGIIRGKDDAGTVIISSYEDLENYVITISDDGRGFDPKGKKNDGKVHVGLSSSRERIEKLAGGKLLIDSVLGKGTQQKIVIPKKRGKV